MYRFRYRRCVVQIAESVRPAEHEWPPRTVGSPAPNTNHALFIFNRRVDVAELIVGDIVDVPAFVVLAR